MELTRAQALISRSEKTGMDFAVFLVGGSARAASVHTSEYRTYVNNGGADLVGVYNARASAGQIVEDVEATK